MSCSRTPQLTDIELLMALDGEADPEVMMHSVHCPDCRARAGQLQKLQHELTRQLFRAECPSSLVVGEYHLGLLSAAKAAVVEKHLAVCPLCAEERTLLADFLLETSPATKSNLFAPVRRTMRILVARLTGSLSGSGLPGRASLVPAMTGLRGAETDPLIYEADGVQVMAEVLDDAAHLGRKSILGLLTGLDDTSGFQAFLWQGASCLATVELNDLGNFTIDDLAPGDYSLILTGPGMEIHLDIFPVHAH